MKLSALVCLPVWASGSVIQESIASKHVMPLFVRGDKEPFWFSVSFQTSETEVHGTCPTFLRCPNKEDELVTIAGEELGNVEAVPFQEFLPLPRFRDVAGRIGLGMKSLIAKKYLLGITSIDSNVVLEFRKDRSTAPEVAKFQAEVDAQNWNSHLSFSYRTGGGIEHTNFSPLAIADWDPLGELIRLPHVFADFFSSLGIQIRDLHVYMPCHVLEEGLAGEITLTSGTTTVGVAIRKSKNSQTLRSSVPLCETNLYFSPEDYGATVGMRALLDKYDVELDQGTQSVRLLKKLDDRIVPKFPVHPGLHAFRIASVTKHGWIWKRSNTWEKKDFIFTSQWPFEGSVEFWTAKPRLYRDIVVLERIEWIGNPKFDLLPGGHIAVSQEFEWGTKSLCVDGDEGKLSFKPSGFRFVWSKKIMDGPNQELVAEPVNSGPPQKGEFLIDQWPPSLGSHTDYLTLISRESSDAGVWGIWFGHPVVSIDPMSHVISIKSEYFGSEFVVDKLSDRLDFSTETTRYIPNRTPNGLFELIPVHGHKRYPIEVVVVDLRDYTGHLEITLDDVPDRVGSSAVSKMLAPLDQMEIPGRPVVRTVETISGDHIIVEMEPATVSTRVYVDLDEPRATISFDTKSVRFLITDDIALHGNFVVIPAGNQVGALEEGEFVWDSYQVEKVAEGKFQIFLRQYKPTGSFEGPFSRVGSWNGVPNMEIDTAGNLVISAEPDGFRYAVDVSESENGLLITFEAIVPRNTISVSSTVTVSPVEVANGIECPICLEKFAEGESVEKFNVCDHKLHEDCLKGLRKNNGSKCPYCRRPMIP